jgi:hypothetical protein
LDAGVAAGTAEVPRLVPYAHLVVQMRNRAYSPALGRFYQQDPNATAMALIGASVYHGRGVGALVTAFGLEELYGDGANLYAYLGSNPWQRHDALGLSWDPFSMVDEYLAEATGNTAAFLSQIGQGLAATAVVLATVASNLPFPITSTLGELALVALGQQSTEEYMLGAAVGLIPGGRIAAKFGGIASSLGSFVGRLGSSAWTSARHYASRFTGWLSNKTKGLAAAVFELFGRSAKALADEIRVWSEAVAEHVRRHNVPRPDRQRHGVFLGDGVLIAEEAWARARQRGSRPTATGEIDVHMGRVIGWESGRMGTNLPYGTVRIVVQPGTMTVRTAYPIAP